MMNQMMERIASKPSSKSDEKLNEQWSLLTELGQTRTIALNFKTMQLIVYQLDTIRSNGIATIGIALEDLSLKKIASNFWFKAKFCGENRFKPSSLTASCRTLPYEFEMNNGRSSTSLIVLFVLH